LVPAGVPLKTSTPNGTIWLNLGDADAFLPYKDLANTEKKL